MAWWRCESCGGEYDDELRDGRPYFHVCAPWTVGARDERPQPVILVDEHSGKVTGELRLAAEGRGRTLLGGVEGVEAALRARGPQ